jgi:hypothetical protein
MGRVGGGLDALGRLPLPAPTTAPWEWGRGCWTVSLSLRGGSGPDYPPARKLADAMDTIRRYDQLRTVIYMDDSAICGRIDLKLTLHVKLLFQFLLLFFLSSSNSSLSSFYSSEIKLIHN